MSLYENLIPPKREIDRVSRGELVGSKKDKLGLGNMQEPISDKYLGRAFCYDSGGLIVRGVVKAHIGTIEHELPKVRFLVLRPFEPTDIDVMLLAADVYIEKPNNNARMTRRKHFRLRKKI